MAKSFALNILLNTVDRASANIRRINGAMDQLTRKAKSASKQMSRVGKTMTRNLTLPIVGLGVAAVRTASQIEDRFAKVKSLGVRADEMDRLRKATFQTAREIGVPLSQIQDALYDIVSKTASTSDRAGLMRQAAELALSGGGTVQEAVSLITSAVNVYRVKGVEAARTAHAIVAAVQKGGASMAGLAQNFGPQAAVLKGYNIRFDEHLALVGGMTTANLKGAMANTLLGRSVIDLDKGLRKAKLGKLKDLIASSGGYLNALKAIKQQVGGGDAFRKLFGTDEGFRGASIMLSTAKASVDAMKLARSTADVHGDALAERNKTMAASWQRTKNRFSEAASTIGQILAPALEKLAKGLQDVAGWFGQLSPSTQEWTVAGIALVAVMGPLLWIVAKLTKVLVVLKFAVKAVGVALWVLTNPAAAATKAIAFLRLAFLALQMTIMANPIVLLITAIAIAALLIYKYWGPISAFFGRLWDKVKGPFIAFAKFAALLFAPIVSLVMAAWDPIKKFFKAIWDGITVIFEAALGVITEIVAKIMALVDTVKNAAKSLLSDLASIGEDIADSIKTIEYGPDIRSRRLGEQGAALFAGGGQGGASAPAEQRAAITVEFVNSPAGMRAYADRHSTADVLMKLGYQQ